MKFVQIQICILFFCSTLFCADDSLSEEHVLAIAQRRDRAACTIQVAWLRHQINSWKARFEELRDQQLDLQTLADHAQAQLHSKTAELQDEVVGRKKLLSANANKYQKLQEKFELYKYRVQELDTQRIAQLVQKEALYKVLVAENELLKTHQTALKLASEQLREKYRECEQSLVRCNCKIDQLVANANRQRSINCPCCAAKLTLQACEQSCCPGGLALINHTWLTNASMIKMLMFQAANCSKEKVEYRLVRRSRSQ